jgi:hypothetical protein
MPIASQDVREVMNEVWVCLLGGGERLSKGVALAVGGCDWVGIFDPWLRLLLDRDETSSMCDLLIL